MKTTRYLLCMLATAAGMQAYGQANVVVPQPGSTEEDVTALVTKASGDVPQIEISTADGKKLYYNYYDVDSITIDKWKGTVGVWKDGKHDNYRASARDIVLKHSNRTYTYSAYDEKSGTWSDYTPEAPVWLKVKGLKRMQGSFILDYEAVDVPWTSKGLLKSAMIAKDVDLSMVNNDGSPRPQGAVAGGRTTANCYMVHAAGSYRIPLVYGNAIKDGKGNPAAYHTTVDNYYAQANLVNHLDEPIWTGEANSETDPWIKSHGINVDGAKLIWQDSRGLISEVGVDGDFLTFTVSQDNITEGNAVIAATAGGTVVWSWHVWITTETFSKSSLVTVNTGKHTYYVTPVNIGQVVNRSGVIHPGGQYKVRVTSPDDIKFTYRVNPGTKYSVDTTSTVYGYSPYYQISRKDAEMPATGGYDINGNPVSFSSFSEGNTIGAAIQHPTTIYSNKTLYKYAKVISVYRNHPYSDYRANYWDMNQIDSTKYSLIDKKSIVEPQMYTPTLKTVYDPCPPGYCIPTSGLHGYFWNNKFNGQWTSIGDVYGYKMTIGGKPLFYPAFGKRNLQGVLRNVSIRGNYWSASILDFRAEGQNITSEEGFIDWEGVLEGLANVRAVAE